MPKHAVTNIDLKVLARIEKFMLKNEPRLMCPTSMSVFAYNTFVFPDGKSVRVDAHDTAAEIVGEELGINDIKKSPDLERCGLVRTGCIFETFHINADIPFTRKAEENVIDQIIKVGPKEIIASLASEYEEQANALRRRLGRQFEVPVVSALKSCGWCGKVFRPPHRNMLTCSDKCKRAKLSEWQKQWHASHPKQKVERECIQCGKKFGATNLHRKMCSKECVAARRPQYALIRTMGYMAKNGCYNCGQPLDTPYRGLFCSMKCSDKNKGDCAWKYWKRISPVHNDRSPVGATVLVQAGANTK